MAIDEKDLSPEIIERIIHLNNCLYQEARWLGERAVRTQEAYFNGGGKEWQKEGGDGEGFDLRGIVKCSLADDDPAFTPHDEYANRLAASDSSLINRGDGIMWMDCGLNEEPIDGMLGWSEHLPPIEAFRGVPFCYLFHEVFEHELHCNLDYLIRIGEIEVNLTLARQHSFVLESELLPGKEKEAYLRSVFSQTPCSSLRRVLTNRELHYARLLNQKMLEAQIWIEGQTRQGEKEYLAIGGRDNALVADNIYEDYEMMIDVAVHLGENHPEYEEDEDNILATHRESVYKKRQNVFGRVRKILQRPLFDYRFICGLDYSDKMDDEFNPCGLFRGIFTSLDYEWLKVLSIGEIWSDVLITQRRIIKI